MLNALWGSWYTSERQSIPDFMYLLMVYIFFKTFPDANERKHYVTSPLVADKPVKQSVCGTECIYEREKQKKKNQRLMSVWMYIITS